MDNSTAFLRSMGGCSTKKCEKSKVDYSRVDKAVKINLSLSNDLLATRFFEAKARIDSGRFNGKDPGERASLADSIGCRAYSGLQAARYLDLTGAKKIQIGSLEPVIDPSKTIWPGIVGRRPESICLMPRERPNLKPLSADSYLPYLNTI